MSKLHGWLTRIVASYPGDRRMAAIVLSITLTSVLILIIADINRELMFVIGALLLTGLILTWKGVLIPIAISMPIVGLVGLSYLIFINYGLRDTAMLGLPVIIVAAGLLTGQWGSLIFGAFCLGVVALYGAAEAAGWIHTDFSAYNQASDYLAAALAIILVIVFQWAVISRLNASIHQAQKEVHERARAEIQVKRRLVELDAINQVSQATVSELKPDSVIRLVGEKTGSIFNTDGVSIALLERSVNMITFPYFNYRGQTLTLEPVIPGKGLASLVLQTGQPLRLDSLQAQIELGINAQEPSSESYLGVPISAVTPGAHTESSAVRIETIGVLSIQKNDPHAFEASDERLLTIIASNIAAALQNARLFEASQRQIDELVLLRDVALAGATAADEDGLLAQFVHIVHQALKPDLFGVALWEAEEGVLRGHPSSRGLTTEMLAIAIAPGFGVLGWVASNRHPLRLSNVQVDPRYVAIDSQVKSELCVPIMARAQFIGVIDIESRKPNAYSEADERLLMTLSGQLATVIDRLRAEAELRTLNIELEHRVQERTSALEQANRELESFSYSVSHDLRAPLRAIDGFSRILVEEYDDKLDDEGRRLFGFILQATQRMNALIDDLLKLSRITRVELTCAPIDLSEMAEGILATLKLQDPERIVNIQIQPGLTVVGDPNLVQIMLENLFGNAWKFTSRQASARIEFGASEQDGKQVFYVRDDGVGFDMEHAHKLFGSFQRLHSPDEFEGSGIGLATVQRIIQRHSGRIWAEAQIEQGATFFFILPV